MLRTHEICPYNNQTLPICYEQVWSHYSHWCCYATNTGNHVNLTSPLSSYLFELLVMNSCELQHSGIWLLCLMHPGFVQSGQRNIQWHVNTSHRHMHHCNYWKKPQATDAETFSALETTSWKCSKIRDQNKQRHPIIWYFLDIRAQQWDFWHDFWHQNALLFWLYYSNRI